MASGFDPKRRSADSFAAPDEELFNIALGHGEFDSTTFTGNHIRYWALGGRHHAEQAGKTGHDRGLSRHASRPVSQGIGGPWIQTLSRRFGGKVTRADGRM